MNITELLQTKAFVKSGVAFNTPDRYINPFIELLQPLSPTFEVKTSGVVENANEDETHNTAYSRALVTAKIGLDNVFKFQAGIVYGLDVQKPIIKTFCGLEVSACTNLCIFNASHVSQAFLTDDFRKIYTELAQNIERYESIAEEYKGIAQGLKERILTIPQIQATMGRLLEHAVKDKFLGTSVVLSAANAIYDAKSAYAIKEGKTTAWNLYNATTAYVTEKTDILDKTGKTLSLSKFFLS